MPNLLHVIRAKAPSKRAMLVIGGAAAIAVGVVQTTDTLAANNDAVTARASQIASENFFPVPVGSGISCSNKSGGYFNLSWTAPANAPAGMTYRLEAWEDNGTSPYQTWNTTTTNSNSMWVDKSQAGRTYFRIRVRSVSSQGELSTGYISHSVYSESVFKYNYCVGGGNFGQENVSSWQQSATWTPAAPQSIGPQSADLMRGRPAVPKSTTSSDVPKPSASSSETRTPSIPPSTEPSAPSSTEEVPSSAESSPDKITIAITASGDKRTLIISNNGEKVCPVDLEDGDVPSVNGDVVSVTNGSSTKTVNTKTCAMS